MRTRRSNERTCKRLHGGRRRLMSVHENRGYRLKLWSGRMTKRRRLGLDPLTTRWDRPVKARWDWPVNPLALRMKRVA